MGGWSRGAKPKEGWAIIDLTGNERPAKSKIEAINDAAHVSFEEVLKASQMKFGPWLALPITDYDVPPWGKRVWAALAGDVAKMLNGGTDILMCCQGGHGRTGLAASILLYILRPDLCVDKHPIEVVREVHCNLAVENNKQIDYVCDILAEFGLSGEKGDHIQASKSFSIPTSYSGPTAINSDDYYKKWLKEHNKGEKSGSKLVWNANDHVKVNGGLVEDWCNTFGL